MNYAADAIILLGRVLFGGFLIYVILVTVVVHWYDLTPRMPKWLRKYENELHTMWMSAHQVKREPLRLREDLSILVVLLLVGYGSDLLGLAVVTCLTYIEGYLYFRYISPSKKITPIYRIDSVTSSDVIDG